MTLNFDFEVELLLDNLMLESYLFLEANEMSLSQVPDEILKRFPRLFSEEEALKLPPHRDYDCVIDLQPNPAPARGKVYSLTQEEDRVLKEWINECLQKGFIRPSSSPWASPCFYVKQKNKLRLCMDYRALNSQTIKDRYPIPLIVELLRELSKGRYFTTLDLRGAYNFLRIKAGHEFKTAFVTKYGQYEFLVMPFGLANAPAQFQRFMNDLFRDKIGNYVLVYLDDIVIYSNDLESHKKHVAEVLEILEANDLKCKPEKCHFYQESIKYLGYIISANGISMDPEKVEAITEWPTPRNVKQLQTLLGFANFYRSLINNFADITAPLTKLLKKDSKFGWSNEQQNAFLRLKAAFRSDTFLAHPNEEEPFIVEGDASDHAIGSILSQKDSAGILRPVAFFSRQMIPAERNYEIYDKELLIIVESLKHWRHFLQGGKHPVTVFSDHKNLEYFMTTKKLSRRQARWSMILSEYNFKVFHRPGKLNGKADCLSRRPDYEIDKKMENIANILKPEQICMNSLMAEMSINELVKSDLLGLEFDPEIDWPLVIAHFLKSDSNQWLEVPDHTLELCKAHAGQFRYRDNTFVRVLEDGISTAEYVKKSRRAFEINRIHKGLAHLKTGSLLEIFKQRFWWPGMEADIRQFIDRCPECQLNKSNTSTHVQPQLRPIPPVPLPFQRWGLDAVQNLVETKSSMKHILTAIDYATRWVVAKAVKELNEDSIAEFLYELTMQYGAPYEIITDRAKYFLSEGIAEYKLRLGIRHLATSPYHPQTNGMVERMHAMVGHGITTLVAGRTDRWDEFLDQTLFAIRVRQHAVTKHSPFYLLYGVHPRLPGDSHPPPSKMQPLDEIEQMEQRGEFTARTLDEMGQARAAAYERSRIQAEAMRRRNNIALDSPDHFFKVGDWVKMKHQAANKFDFKWKGPYHVVDLGFAGTCGS